MKLFLLSILLLSCALSLMAQVDDQVFVSSSTERDTIFAEVPQPMLSIGFSGGVAFISPDKLNNQIENNNTVFNTDEFPLKRPAQWSFWAAYRPKNLPTFLTLRAELLSSSRTYTFTTNVTGADPSILTSVQSTSKHTYTVLPFSIGSGSVIYKTTAKGEIGFIYALAWITQTTDVPGYSSSETVYEGEGYGFRLNLQQVIPIERTFSATLDIGYRFIVINEFRDAKGVSIKNTELDYSGMNLLLGISYGF
ncbi:MAG: hypothetical protein M0R68_09965 [Bacteroidetes bacterium]|nr:hypothetical protein [Bacteroidota bacterium]